MVPPPEVCFGRHSFFGMYVSKPHVLPDALDRNDQLALLAVLQKLWGET